MYVSQGEPGGGPGYGAAATDGREPGLGGRGGGAGGAWRARAPAAVTFASGQAASTALMLALADGRESIVFPSDGYYNTRALAARLRPHGAAAVAVDLLDLGAVAAALRAGPAVLWAETPTNPLLRVADLTALAALAAAAGAPLVVDNTVATGLLQKPLDFGAAASVYSLTKSISGHSDVLGGAVVTRDAALAAAVLLVADRRRRDPRPVRELAGAARPEDAAAAHRAGLGERPGGRVVPGRPPAGDRRALPGAGPVGGGPAAAAARLRPAAVVRDRGHAPPTRTRWSPAARLIVPATSFGGVESSWERRARWPAETAPATLIRLSCGIEPAEDLLADLAQALRAARPWREP